MNNYLTWLEIDKQNIAYNLHNIKNSLSNKTKMMVVVKSNAYGHGLVQFAKEAVKNGADYLGVVNIDEAITLREARVEEPILVLGYVPDTRIKEAVKNNIEIAIVSQEQAINLLRIQFLGQLKVHIKVETGINRLGISEGQILAVYKELSKYKKIDIVGIYSHLASVEENNMDYTANQFNNFGNIIKKLEKYNIDIPVKHISASGGALIFKESHFNMVRIGIAAYGLWPSAENKKNFMAEADADVANPFLKPVLNFKTKIAQVKEINSGYVGYGCTYRVMKNMKIAIIPVGYYEGLDRGLSCPNVKKITKTERSGCGEVLVNGFKCPIIGRICMNMTIIDVSKLGENAVRAGDEVVIIGQQKKNKILVEELAKKIDTINYEIVSRIPEHIPRIYK